jgi:hypothetical protein
MSSCVVIHNKNIKTMKNTTIFIFWSCAIFTLFSCGVKRFIAPPFTDLDRILKLRSGQNVEAVNNTLGIKPHDIVHCYKTGSKILIFNYRLKDRNMVLASRSANQVVHSAEAQKDGENWYNLNYKELFLLFRDDTLSGIYGERMFSEGSYLELAHDKFAFGDTSLTVEGKMQSGNTDYQFLYNAYQERNATKERAVLQEDETRKKRLEGLRKAVLGLLVVTAIIL